MRIGSLCSGYGGLEMGVQAVYGGTTAWVSDIDKGACKILAHRFPGVPNIGDFTKTDWSTVEPVDLICAGFPCQPVSHAGKRLGDDDERWLWDDVLRAVREVRPSRVVLENVRGLLTARSGELFGRVIGSLAAIGYDANWHGIKAADPNVEAPHNRFRVFIDAEDTAADNSGWGWGEGRTESARLVGGPDAPVGSLLPTPAVNDMGEGKTVEAWDEWTERMKAAHGNGNGHGASLSIEAQRLLPTTSVADVTGGRKSRSGDRSGELLLNGIAAAQAWGQYAAAIARWESLTRPAPPPTETGPKGNPRLAAAFSEWMMGLPAGWVTDVPGITRNEALRALGNGVVPQQAAAALRVMQSWEVAA